MNLNSLRASIRQLEDRSILPGTSDTMDDDAVERVDSSLKSDGDLVRMFVGSEFAVANGQGTESIEKYVPAVIALLEGQD